MSIFHNLTPQCHRLAIQAYLSREQIVQKGIWLLNLDLHQRVYLGEPFPFPTTLKAGPDSNKVRSPIELSLIWQTHHMDLVRSRKRVIDHGEVFTPPWMVDSMLQLVSAELARVESRFLESACGSGNFLKAILKRKLGVVAARYKGNQFESNHYGLLALMSLYGIELLEDNVIECREELLGIFASALSGTSNPEAVKAAEYVLSVNIIHGDALSMQFISGVSGPIIFPEWTYLGKGRYQRRDFQLQVLTQMSSFGEDTLFADMGQHEIFIPCQEYSEVTIGGIAKWNEI